MEGRIGKEELRRKEGRKEGRKAGREEERKEGRRRLLLNKNKNNKSKEKKILVTKMYAYS
jgi:hypothetical protein